MSNVAKDERDEALVFDCRASISIIQDVDGEFGMIENQYDSAISHYAKIHVHSGLVNIAFIYTITDPSLPHYDPANYAKMMEIAGREGANLFAHIDPATWLGKGEEDVGTFEAEFDATAHFTYDRYTIDLMLKVGDRATLFHTWDLTDDPLNFVILSNQMAVNGVDVYESLRPGSFPTLGLEISDDEVPF